MKSNFITSILTSLNKRTCKTFVFIWVMLLHTNYMVYAQYPTINFSFTSGNINPGDTIVFTNLSTGFSSSTVFVWNFGERCYYPTDPDSIYNWDLCNDTVTGLISLNHVYAQGRPYLVSLKATDTNGLEYKFEKQVIVQALCSCNNVCENIVCNGTFEQVSFCHNKPPYMGNYSIGIPNQIVSSDASTCWYSIMGSPDLLMNNTCTSANGPVINAAIPSPFMCQTDHTSNGNFQAFAGIITVGGSGSREYFQQQIAPPIFGNYDVSFWTSLRGFSGVASDVGLLLSTNPPAFMAAPNNDILIGTPQLSAMANTGSYISDKNEWHKIEQNININAPINYVTIGNFELNLTTWVGFGSGTIWCPNQPPNLSGLPYYVIDDVVLKRHVFNQSQELITHDCDDAHTGAINITVDGSFTPYTFLWSNGATTEDIHNITSGTYTVTVTDVTGCTTTKMFNIYGKIPTPQIQGDPYGCSINDIYTLTNPLAAFYSYNWFSTNGIAGNGTTAHVDFNVPGFGTLNYVVTDNRSGCTSSLAFEVYPCCQPNSGTTGVNLDLSGLSSSFIVNNPANYMGFFNASGSAFYTGLSSGNGYKAAINSTFTVDANLNLAEADIVLGPDAQIIVKAGHKLSITEHSHLHTCDGNYMWKGIVLEPGATLETAFYPLIEEAQIAVNSLPGATVMCNDHTTFNANNQSIILNFDAASPAYTGFIYQTKFECNQQSNGNPITLIAPYHTQIPQTGIQINDAAFVKIGNENDVAIPPLYQNLFNNLNCGIHSNNSTVEIYNNKFSNIYNAQPEYVSSGYGIYIRPNQLQTNFIAIVGGANMGNTTRENVFYNCNNGIYMRKNIDCFINNNTFTNIMEQPGTSANARGSGKGIEAFNATGSNLIVTENRFNNFNQGIYMSKLEDCYLYFHYNTFNYLGNSATIGTSAITISNPLATSYSQPMDVQYNLIKQCRKGISISKFENVQVHDNTILFAQADIAAHPSDAYKGILIENSAPAGNTVKSNWIYKDGSNPNQSYLDNLRGIDIAASPNTNINSNLIKKMGSGIYFYNTTQVNTVHCNQIDTCRAGVHFTTNSDIGTQGSATAAQENTWHFPTSNYYAFQRDNTCPNPTWFVRNGGTGLPFKPQTNYMSPSGFVSLPYGTQVNDCEVPCPDCNNQRMAEIVTEQGSFATLSDEVKYQAKKGVYELLDADSTYMNAGLPSDAVLQNFYDSARFTNMGLLNDVTLLIQDSANFLANAINSWVSPINHFEENTKQVNQIYLATWAEDISEFDSLQYETLYTIATESAATGGNATYAARVMLGLDINDDATQNNRLVSQTASIENNNGVTIYPNPVTNVATIAIDGIENEALAVELKDVLGKVVLPFKKLSATGTIDFGKIPNGIYFIAVYLNGNYLSSKKLIVSH